jgi:uncharacterized membrane protein YccC
MRQTIRRANAAFEDYLRLTGEGRFEEASRALDRLQEALNRLAEQSEERPATRPAGP